VVGELEPVLVDVAPLRHRIEADGPLPLRRELRIQARRLHLPRHALGVLGHLGERDIGTVQLESGRLHCGLEAAQALEVGLEGEFYPGTQVGRAGGSVRVPVCDAGPAPVAADLGFPDGGEVRGAGAGFPVSVPKDEAVTVVWDGSTYRVTVHGPAVALGPRQA